MPVFLDRAVAACQHLSCNGTKWYVPITWQRGTGQFRERCGVCDLLWGGIWPCTMGQAALSEAPPAAIRDGKPRLICSTGVAAEDAGTSKRELGVTGAHCDRSRSISLGGGQAEQEECGSQWLHLWREQCRPWGWGSGGSSCPLPCLRASWGMDLRQEGRRYPGESGTLLDVMSNQ